MESNDMTKVIKVLRNIVTIAFLLVVSGIMLYGIYNACQVSFTMFWNVITSSNAAAVAGFIILCFVGKKLYNRFMK
jgi:hypothetical protein